MLFTDLFTGSARLTLWARIQPCENVTDIFTGSARLRFEHVTLGLLIRGDYWDVPLVFSSMDRVGTRYTRKSPDSVAWIYFNKSTEVIWSVNWPAIKLQERVVSNGWKLQCVISTYYKTLYKHNCDHPVERWPRNKTYKPRSMFVSLNCHNCNGSNITLQVNRQRIINSPIRYT